MFRGIALVLLSAVATAQTAAAPAFEVASVKAKVIPRGHYYFAVPAPSRFVVSGTRVKIQGPLFHLMAAAYGVQFFQIAAADNWPEKWASKDTYEIDARAPGETAPTRGEVRAMLQGLLADRFQLQMHRESREMPVYNLLVGSGAPKIKPSSSTDVPRMEGEGSFGAQVRVRYTNFSIADFVIDMMSQFDRPLLDKTGLTGGFDFTLEYRSQPPGMTAAMAADAGLADPEPGMPVVASIKGQMGLRVVSARGMVEVLVIDHAERPSEN